MATGYVKWFSAPKGFGFISPTGGGPDVFVHVSAAERAGWNTLSAGQLVDFEVGTQQGKSAAGNLAVQPRGTLEPPRVVLSDVLSLTQLANELAQVKRELKSPTDARALYARVHTAVAQEVEPSLEELLRDLRRDPRLLYDLSSAQFERVIEVIFRSNGHQTELLSSDEKTRSGVSFISISGMWATTRLAVQCQMSASEHLVDIQPVRSLTSVLDRFHAHQGVVATTGTSILQRRPKQLNTSGAFLCSISTTS